VTTPDATPDDALELERARSAAALAALHDELDETVAALARSDAEREALRTALAETEARARAAEHEVTAIRNTRAVRWATRMRAVLGR
jgi:hypothetical protein